MPLTLLPMNTTKMDVFNYVINEVNKMCNGKINDLVELIPKIVACTIPPHTNSSVLQILQMLPLLRVQVFDGGHNEWCHKDQSEGYIYSIDISSNARTTRLLVLQEIVLYIFWSYMYIILNGIDQNTTMVPKMRQTVKNVESWCIKIHLCGALVHEIGL